MEDKLRFNTTMLRGVVGKLAAKFHLVQEFPFEDRRQEWKLAVAECIRIPEKELYRYVVSLGGRPVENLIFACHEEGEDRPDSLTSERLLQVLEIRMSKRLIEIIWQFYQFKYKQENPNIKAILEIAGRYIEENDVLTPEAEMLMIFIKDRGKNKIVEMLNEQSMPINSFAGLHKLNLKSPMLKSISKKYLSQCTKSDYHLNEAWMIRLIGEVGLSKIMDLLSNYLSCFDVEEYVSNINVSILEKMGYPYASLDWKEIPDPLKRKFSDWNALRLLEGHFQTKSNKKYGLLSNYISSSVKVFFMRNEELLVIDFGKFVVIDDVLLETYSFLVDKQYFEKIQEELETCSIASFVKSRDDMTPAREYVIEETDSNVFQLDYQEVGKLYIKKTLDIMLGLTPDTRPSKNIMQVKKSLTKDDGI
jgi:hypothetical protein